VSGVSIALPTPRPGRAAIRRLGHELVVTRGLVLHFLNTDELLNAVGPGSSGGESIFDTLWYEPRPGPTSVVRSAYGPVLREHPIASQFVLVSGISQPRVRAKPWRSPGSASSAVFDPQHAIAVARKRLWTRADAA